MKRTPLARGTSQLKRTSSLRTKTPLRASTMKFKQPNSSKRSKAPKSPTKGYQTPKWFNKIKLGSHGNTPAQKKYWKVVSDTYRQEDFKKFHGKCVTCPAVLDRWEDGQLAHYKAWSVCNAWFKYERKNLRFSCPNCNRLSDGVIGNNFAEALKKQYGEQHLEWIEKTNLAFRGQKLEQWEIVEKVIHLRPDLVE